MKLFVSSFLILFLWCGISVHGQTTWYLQDEGVVNGNTITGSNASGARTWHTYMNDPDNWYNEATPSAGALNANPSDFADATATWDMQGFNGCVSGGWTLAGSLENSNNLKNAGFEDYDLANNTGYSITLNGPVASPFITTTSNGPLTSKIEYGFNGNSNIIGGNYAGDIAFTNGGIKTAASNIAFEGTFIINAANPGTLDMNDNILSRGTAGQLSIDPTTAAYTVETSVTASTFPLPDAIKWGDGDITLLYNANGNQTISTAKAGFVKLAGSGVKTIPATKYVEIDGGNLTVESGVSLRMQTISLNDFGGVGFTSGSTFTNNGTNNIFKEYWIDVSGGGRYYGLGVCVEGADLQGLQEGGIMNFSSNNSGSAWEWNSTNSQWEVATATNNSLTEGYWIYAGPSNGADFLVTTSRAVDLQGNSLVTTDQSVTLNYDDGQGANADPLFVGGASGYGWNLISNPFTATFNWDATENTLDDAANVNSAIYMWNGSAYASYQNGAGTNTATQYIAPGQSFFLQTTSGLTNPTTETFHIEASEVETINQYYKKAQDIASLTFSKVASPDRSDEFLIRFEPQATDAYDGKWDAHDLNNAHGMPNARVVIAGEYYSICSVEPTGRAIFPVNFTDADNGESIEVSLNDQNLSAYNEVYIKDKKQGNIKRLTMGGTYTFINDINYGADRFEIRFSAGIGMEENTAGAEPLYDVYSGNGNLNFIFSEENFTSRTATLYDLQGKPVMEFKISSPQESFSVASLSTGVYIAKLNGDGLNKPRKLFINNQ